MPYTFSIEEVLEVLAAPPSPTEKSERLVSRMIAELDDRTATLRTDGHSTNSLRNMIGRLEKLFTTLRQRRQEIEKQRREEEEESR